MKKNRKEYILGILCMLTLVISGCGKSEQQQKLETFLHKQISNETYLEARGDMERLKVSFIEFFTQETYEKYLEDGIGYIYPQFYYLINVQEVAIKTIECKEVKGLEKDITCYLFDVTYEVSYSEEEKIKKSKMNDQIEIKIDSLNKIQEVTIHNTSDVIGKLFLDIKVQ